MAVICELAYCASVYKVGRSFPCFSTKVECFEKSQPL